MMMEIGILGTKVSMEPMEATLTPDMTNRASMIRLDQDTITHTEETRIPIRTGIRIRGTQIIPILIEHLR